MSEPPPLTLSFVPVERECTCSACRLRRELRGIDASELLVTYYDGVVD